MGGTLVQIDCAGEKSHGLPQEASASELAGWERALAVASGWLARATSRQQILSNMRSFLIPHT